MAAARARIGNNSEVRILGTGPREREKAIPYLGVHAREGGEEEGVGKKGVLLFSASNRCWSARAIGPQRQRKSETIPRGTRKEG
jgi:hypothetical protein